MVGKLCTNTFPPAARIERYSSGYSEDPEQILRWILGDEPGKVCCLLVNVAE